MEPIQGTHLFCYDDINSKIIINSDYPSPHPIPMCLENDLKISSQYNIRLYVSYLYASRYGFGDNA